MIQKIKEKLPHLFQLAEIDNSRDGKLGMEVGSARERIVIALLIYKFGEKHIKTDIPITEKETDVIVFDEPISIKTVTSELPRSKDRGFRTTKQLMCLLSQYNHFLSQVFPALQHTS